MEKITNLAFYFILGYYSIMIVRIVKLTINTENVKECKAFASSTIPAVLNFNGCRSLEVLQDVNNKTVLFTYSLWDSDAALNEYRHSPYFKETWATLKQWFKKRPEAWSTEVVTPIT